MKSYSPLRYPGGKGMLYNDVKNIMTDNDFMDKTYTEPFAGGFGIGLKLLINEDLQNCIINDYDYRLYGFWDSLFNHTDTFVELIEKSEITLDSWQVQKEIYRNYENYSKLEVGFSTFFLNRTNYSGIIKGGPIGGHDQLGKYKLACRFNKPKLIELIYRIAQYRDKVEIYNYDAKEFIERIAIPRKKELFINFDPPYVKRGKELYTNFYDENDHIILSKQILMDLPEANWIITYDDCLLIRQLYRDLNIEEFSLNYSAGKKKKGKEVLIKSRNVR